MKAFLFLYPIKEYFEVCLETHQRAFERNNYDPRRINDIINARYRQRGYSIHWLLFSTDEDSKKPDLSIASDYITICEEDTILTAGISAIDYFRESSLGLKNPDSAFILAQMPDLTELVLGGFHQLDCVDKLAEYVYQKGIPIFVDEDTTELFFARTSLCGDIPLVRETFTLADLGISKNMMELAKEMRKGKPWVTQI